LLAGRRGTGTLLGVVAALVVVAVGASRVVLGVHFPTDVLAGWDLAVAVVGAVVLVDRRAAAIRTAAADVPEAGPVSVTGGSR